MTSPVQQTDEQPAVEPKMPAGLELPPRPRRRLIAPVPLSLLAIVPIAGGFIAGAHVQKGQASAAAGASGFSAPGGSASAGAKSSGAAAISTRPTTGKVTSRSGKTLYVTGSEGDTTKVATSAATSVTKTVKTKVRAIHPGETMTITGGTDSKGAVSAGAISVGSVATGATGLLGAG